MNTELGDWIQQRNPIIGLDFDGTLVPIQPDPEKVALGARALGILERLVVKYDCAFISGRMLCDLLTKVPVRPAHFIGTHGAEILKTDGTLWRYENLAWLDWRAKYLDDFSRWVERRGGEIEDKGLGLSIHYRRADNNDQQWWLGRAREELRERLLTVADVMDGIAVWNILPRGAPNKGSSSLRLCQELGRGSLVFFGDETTDEKVFALREVEVFGVKVGPGETLARARVGSPDEALAILRQLI